MLFQATFRLLFISFLFVFLFCTHCDTSLEFFRFRTGMCVRGHFAWRLHIQEAVHTYFAFTTAKTFMTEALWVTEAMPLQVVFVSLLTLVLKTKSVDV